jgi:hypothetical protein
MMRVTMQQYWYLATHDLAEVDPSDLWLRFFAWIPRHLGPALRRPPSGTIRCASARVPPGWRRRSF